MTEPARDIRTNLPITTESIINLLGVVYVHTKTKDAGDLYLTEYGIQHADILDIENWYERSWFESHRFRLTGTSSVFRVVTKEIGGKSLQLVVKNNRVGEDVPLNTHTLYEFINAEFNSPWEEFALTMELRDNRYGPRDITIHTQKPLAIYIPSEELQLWQTGRSRERINKITRKHPGINLDILRQYKMVYKWIDGLSIVEALKEIGVADADMGPHLTHMTEKGTRDLAAKGFVVADMKPSHIIIEEKNVIELRRMGKNGTDNQFGDQIEFIHSLVEEGRYSLIDYELLIRTPAHEEQVKYKRRHLYLDDQRDRFRENPLPPFLTESKIFEVPYVHGHVESTGGMLWVVGRNPRLFDYFLPERWRRTPCQSFSKNHEVFYTVTKDNIHIVWKTSRTGELPSPDERGIRHDHIREFGINSPFEEFSIAQHLTTLGIPTVYARAIYMTGSAKIEPAADARRFQSHHDIPAMDGLPVLREDRDYITIRGYYNGSDSWVAEREGTLCTPFDLERAVEEGVISAVQALRLLERTRWRLKNVGFDGALLELNDNIISIDPSGNTILDSEGFPETRICNFELIHKVR